MSNKLSLLVNFVGVDRMSGALRTIVGLGRNGSQSLRALNADARRLQREMRDVGRELQGASGNVTHLIDRERALERALAGVNRQIDRQRRIGAINADRDAMVRRGADLQGKGAEQVVGTAALLTPFILATKGAMDFSSGLVDIQQKAGLSNAATDGMALSILRLGRATHQLPDDMRQAVDSLAGFGLDPLQAVRMVGPIGRLGTAFKVDLADGAAAAYANLSNLKVPIAQTTEALDIMAAAGNHGAFEARDMARWFPALTAQMQALGQHGTPAVADLSAALEIVRRGAGDSDQAANNLENLFAKINAPATIRAFDKNFGIDLPAALRKAYAQGKTPLEAIAELTKQATGGDLSKLGFVFEDMQAQSAVRQLILDLRDYKQIRASIAGEQGVIDRAFAQREARDAALGWKDFLVAVQSVSITLGTTMLPVATRFLNTAVAVTTRVNDWAQANPRLAGTLATIALSLLSARIGIGALQFAFGGLLGPLARVIAFSRRIGLLGAIGRTLLRLGPVLTSIGPLAVRTFGLMRMAALFLARGVVRAGLMMLANPIVLAITAIIVALGVAGYLIHAHWGKIQAAFGAGIAWVKNAMAALPAWLKNIGSAMMQGLLMALNPMLLAEKLLSVARAGVTAFKSYFGIKSPSRLFMAMGGHMTSGLALGLDRGAAGPQRSMARLITGLAPPSPAGRAPARPALGARLANAPALRPAASAARSAAPAAPPVTIHIHGAPGQDVEALATAVIRRLERVRGIRARSSYEEDR